MIYVIIIILLDKTIYRYIMTSTLSGFVFSLICGAVVLIGIAGAVIWVSSNDSLKRPSSNK